jgi:predicted phosphoribosyltransferase
LPQYRDRKHVFADRSEAGRVLARMLVEYLDSDAIVLAIPAGGVPVAAEIARELHLPLDVAVVSKITLPWDSEAGFGAVAWDGTVMLNDDMRFYFLLTDKAVGEGVTHATAKVRRRLDAFRDGRPFPDLSQRPAIVVDDGLASGFTMKVAIHALRNAGAQTIILAVPTALEDVAQEMVGIVEEVYCANVRHGHPCAVADAYQQWRDVSEHEALEVLTAAATATAAEAEA